VHVSVSVYGVIMLPLFLMKKVVMIYSIIMWKFGLEASLSEFICSPLQLTDSSRVCLLLNFDSEFSSPLLGAAPAS